MNGGYESNLVATVFCYKTIIRKEEQYQMARRYNEIIPQDPEEKKEPAPQREMREALQVEDLVWV